MVYVWYLRRITGCVILLFADPGRAVWTTGLCAPHTHEQDHLQIRAGRYASQLYRTSLESRRVLKGIEAFQRLDPRATLAWHLFAPSSNLNRHQQRTKVHNLPGQNSCVCYSCSCYCCRKCRGKAVSTLSTSSDIKKWNSSKDVMFWCLSMQ